VIYGISLIVEIQIYTDNSGRRIKSNQQLFMTFLKVENWNIEGDYTSGVILPIVSERPIDQGDNIERNL